MGNLFGFFIVFTEYPIIKEVLKYVGAAYILYLAWLMVGHSVMKQSKGAQQPFSFIQAATFQWVNPKAWMMGVGVVSLFSLSENDFLNALLISIFYFVICIPCVGVWLVGGVSLQNFLKDDKKRKYFNQFMAVLLVLSIILIFI